MNIRCPNCQTLFRVDPERIPEAGIRTRCSSCSAVFELDRSGVRQPEPAPAATVPVAPAPTFGGSGASERQTNRPAPQPAEPQPAQPASARPTTGPAAPPAAGGAPSRPPAQGGPRRPVFGQQDPDTRAQRIARALVSDMVVYNSDRRDASLAAGTLRSDFKEEILKSWEEYVEQVGEEMARKTAHFRNALNSILAKGQQVF